MHPVLFFNTPWYRYTIHPDTDIQYTLISVQYPCSKEYPDTIMIAVILFNYFVTSFSSKLNDKFWQIWNLEEKLAFLHAFLFFYKLFFLLIYCLNQREKLMFGIALSFSDLPRCPNLNKWGNLTVTEGQIVKFLH